MNSSLDEKHGRGLHIIVINSENCNLAYDREFDTSKSSIELETCIQNDFPLFPEGWIIIATCKDDCVKNLSRKSKEWFRSIGSKKIDKLKYQCSFAMIAIAGKPSEINERISMPATIDQPVAVS